MAPNVNFFVGFADRETDDVVQMLYSPDAACQSFMFPSALNQYHFRAVFHGITNDFSEVPWIPSKGPEMILSFCLPRTDEHIQ